MQADSSISQRQRQCQRQRHSAVFNSCLIANNGPSVWFGRMGARASTESTSIRASARPNSRANSAKSRPW